MKQKKEEITTMSDLERFRLIRSEMVRNGLTYQQICDEAQVSRQRVTQVFKGHAKGYRIRNVFTKLCGIPVTKLWPDTPPQYREAA